jgi:hypothetical protein
MLTRNPEAASALTREVFQTLAVHFFPATVLDLSTKNYKDISSTVGDGWIKWKDFSADGIQHVASHNKSAKMVELFAGRLLASMECVMSNAKSTLMQLLPLRGQICNIHRKDSALKQTERCSKFVTAFETFSTTAPVQSTTEAQFELWTVLPQMLSFCASIAASAPTLCAKNEPLVGICRSLIAAAQHALCDIFFGYNGIGSRTSPQQLLFANDACPLGLLCLAVPNGEKADVLNWGNARCANCRNPAEQHALAVSLEGPKSPGKELFLRALCRVGSIGWDSHQIMAFVHSERVVPGHPERGANLASFSQSTCEESLKTYTVHLSCCYLSADPTSPSCEQCKPYSLEKCCEELPAYAAAITAEVSALQGCRREELQRVVDTLCGLREQPPAQQLPVKAPDVSAKAGGAAKRQPPQTSESVAKPAAAPISNVTANISASPDQHEDEAVASREPISLAESASAVQSEVDPKAARLQELLKRINIDQMSLDEQKLWITQKSSSELAAAVPDKSDRELLREFAPRNPASATADSGGSPAAKGKGKKKSASEPAGQQPPVPSVPVHESPSSASTAAAQPAPPTAPPSDSRAPAVVKLTARTFAS